MSTETDDVEGNDDYSESSDESDDYENSNESNVREREYMSIYMREKSNKRQIIKNGKVNMYLDVAIFCICHYTSSFPISFIFIRFFWFSKFVVFCVVENREKVWNYMFTF